ncbi:uncharacterized protein LOC131325814 isoform X1 [Rhododendron vialii]|uniref:uncharacterized protein LOC131325814 isoform X1 n=1 Tax=Rhododendron vialii TaxID=182163 RepID=UPI00265FE62F|nr:uncharacterized protein LOC131325814 isoform X1 [Rhododendron vialii]
MMASPLHLQPPTLSTTPTHIFIRSTHLVPSPTTHLRPSSSSSSSSYYYRNKAHLSFFKSLTVVPFALTESEGSSKSLDEANQDLQVQTLLQELAESFVLPADYFGQLPRDLRLDLNDAAFDLSSGAIIDECGRELGETLLNISRAWEQADTSTSKTLVGKLPLLVGSLGGNAQSALGRRLVSAGRRFQSMGQYGQGELQRIAKAMLACGKLLAEIGVSTATNGEPKTEARMLKFGDLQVELTADKAYIGAVISLIFGIISWQLNQGVQSTPENSLQYANDNALLLAKSLRGALLALGYSSSILSAFTAVGLILLGRQLEPKEK